MENINLTKAVIIRPNGDMKQLNEIDNLNNIFVMTDNRLSDIELLETHTLNDLEYLIYGMKDGKDFANNTIDLITCDAVGDLIVLALDKETGDYTDFNFDIFYNNYIGLYEGIGLEYLDDVDLYEDEDELVMDVKFLDDVKYNVVFEGRE
jgi:hypothetical protein